MKRYEVGEAVVFVGADGVARAAIVTEWWGQKVDGQPEPACNVWFASGDPTKRDALGRRMEFSSSVLHRSLAGSGSACWAWQDEIE